MSSGNGCLICTSPAAMAPGVAGPAWGPALTNWNPTPGAPAAAEAALMRVAASAASASVTLKPINGEATGLADATVHLLKSASACYLVTMGTVWPPAPPTVPFHPWVGLKDHAVLKSGQASTSSFVQHSRWGSAGCSHPTPPVAEPSERAIGGALLAPPPTASLGTSSCGMML